MRLLFEMDLKDYENCTHSFVRNSARAIVIRNGKVAMIHSLKYDFYKFPGGGIEEGEDPVDAMIRETREEAGLVIIPRSIQEYGCVHRIQKSTSDETEIFIQDNYYYLCQAEEKTVAQQLDSYEAMEHYTLEYVDPEAVIEKNRHVEHTPYNRMMLEREALVLELLMKEGVIRKMDIFSDALLSETAGKIPAEYDWFAPLIGDWDCDYYDDLIDNKRRHVKGEWIFRRILEGAGIQDIFIFPSRETREAAPQPDGEYGTSLRMFNKKNGCYDTVYTCERCMKRLCFTKEGDKLVGKVLEEEHTYWIFSDITADSFRWENVEIYPDGSRKLICEIFGRRQQR